MMKVTSGIGSDPSGQPYKRTLADTTNPPFEGTRFCVEESGRILNKRKGFDAFRHVNSAY